MKIEKSKPVDMPLLPALMDNPSVYPQVLGQVLRLAHSSLDNAARYPHTHRLLLLLKNMNKDRKRTKNVTHVSGLKCHLCFGLYP